MRVFDRMGETDGQAERVRRIFSVWSAFYDSPFFQLGYYGRVHARLLAAAADLAPRAVLDVGCGTGLLADRLARRWPTARVTGLDLSPEMLAKARTRGAHAGRARFVQGSVYAIPFADGAFDLVTSSVSAHWYLDLDAALAEIARVSRPGAAFLLASLHNGPLALVPGPWRHAVATLSARYRSIGVQRDALERAGFAVVRTRRLLPSNTALFVARRRP
jgi:malonyl-CoA O-methyltransferase